MAWRARWIRKESSCSATVCSIPGVKGEDGGEHYVGGLIEVDGGHKVVKYIPGGEDWTF